LSFEEISENLERMSEDVTNPFGTVILTVTFGASITDETVNNSRILLPTTAPPSGIPSGGTRHSTDMGDDGGVAKETGIIAISKMRQARSNLLMIFISRSRLLYLMISFGWSRGCQATFIYGIHNNLS
jgi:hypothetical protein